MKTILFLRHYQLEKPLDNWMNMSLDQFVGLTTGQLDPQIDISIDQYLTDNPMPSQNFDVVITSTKQRTIQTTYAICSKYSLQIPVIKDKLFDEIPSKFVTVPTKEEFQLMKQNRMLVVNKKRALNTQEKVINLLQIDAYLDQLSYTNILVISHSYLIGLLNYWFNVIHRTPNKFDTTKADRHEIGGVLKGFQIVI